MLTGWVHSCPTETFASEARPALASLKNIGFRVQDLGFRSLRGLGSNSWTSEVCRRMAFRTIEKVFGRILFLLTGSGMSQGETSRNNAVAATSRESVACRSRSALLLAVLSGFHECAREVAISTIKEQVINKSTIACPALKVQTIPRFCPISSTRTKKSPAL